MDNKRIRSAPLSDNLELLGDGLSFRDNLCSMLEQAKCFDDFPHAGIEALARHMKAYRVPGGATIFREGERNSYLCVLIEGRVNVYKEDGSGANKLLTTIRPGSIFGEISLIDDFPYSASVTAVTEARIMLMSRENFRKCIDDDPVLGVRLLRLIARILSARLRATSGQLVDYILAPA